MQTKDPIDRDAILKDSQSLENGTGTGLRRGPGRVEAGTNGAVQDRLGLSPLGVTMLEVVLSMLLSAANAVALLRTKLHLD
jgi:hypothetical protein